MTPDITQKLEARTQEVLALARTKYGVQLANVQVRYDARGRTVARASYTYVSGVMSISYNPAACLTHLDYILHNTIPHEVAHLVCYEKPMLGRRHDAGWKDTCRALGGDGTRLAPHMGLGVPYIYLDSVGKERRISARRHTLMQKYNRSYTYADNGGKLNKTGFVRKEQPVRHAPVAPRQKRVAGVNKAEISRQLIRDLYGKSANQYIIELIAARCNFKMFTAKFYFEKYLTSALQHGA